MAVIGATHWNVRPDVRRFAELVTERFEVSWNTYYDHPFPGWDNRSVDFWGPGGRGDPIDKRKGRDIWGLLMRNRSEWRIRHIIYQHDWWTNWAGLQTWVEGDHSGRLRHVHVTFL